MVALCFGDSGVLVIVVPWRKESGHRGNDALPCCIFLRSGWRGFGLGGKGRMIQCRNTGGIGGVTLNGSDGKAASREFRIKKGE
ncbi:MAG: hypothetical protein K0Q55_1761 [Verrucomicrobia bacterium]|nr:hypothetical protein [Verrucomicrobiota bacterium]